MIRLAQRDEGWPQRFEEAAEELGRLLGDGVVATHHIGSTAVVTVAWVKPVLDILVEVRSLSALAGPVESRLGEHGFEARGEYGIPGRRYFVRAAGAGRPKVHAHVYEHGDAQIDRHLRFRDYLRKHPAEAAAYSALKRRLVAIHGADRAAYQAGKAEFIARAEQRAREDGDRD